MTGSSLKPLGIFLIALLQLLAVSCDLTPENKLYKADKIIDDNPDSAYSILKSIDVAKLDQGNTLLCYRMLMTQAQIERGDSVLSDSTITQVMRLTQFSGHDSLRVKACYYNGVIKAMLGDTAAAVMSLTEAQVAARKINKEYWHDKSRTALDELMGADSCRDKKNNMLKTNATLTYIKTLNDIVLREQNHYIILRHIMVSISAFVLLLLVLVAVSFGLRARLKSKESSRRMERILLLNNEIYSRYNEIQYLNDKLGTSQSARQEMQVKIGNLFRQRWATINKLCDRYLEADGLANKNKILINEVEREVQKMRLPETYSHIEDAVNEYMDGIMSQLRCECGFLSESDFLFISMIYAGLSPRTICLIFDIKFKTYYTRRARLAERIKQTDAPRKSIFLSKLMNQSD